MIYNFKTEEDDQQWTVDTEKLTWARASSILTTPSVKAAENKLARFVPIEEGSLAPMGGGRYALAGRKPTTGIRNEDGSEKQQLAQIAIACVPVTDETDSQIVLVTLIQANVALKDAHQQEIKRHQIELMAPFQAPNRPTEPKPPTPVEKLEEKAAEPEVEATPSA